jgi:hypothetical protein
MTTPFIPHVLQPVIASAAPDPSIPGAAVVSFTVGADYYSFLLDHSALQRLGDQIERVLRATPPKKRRRAPRFRNGPPDANQSPPLRGSST